MKIRVYALEKPGQNPIPFIVQVADTFLSRFRGLMRRTAEDGRINIGRRGPVDAMILTKTKQVHTHFMCFVQRTCYVDKNGYIIRIDDMKRWRMGSYVKGAVSVLELPVETRVPVAVGDRITVAKM